MLRFDIRVNRADCIVDG